MNIAPLILAALIVGPEAEPQKQWSEITTGIGKYWESVTSAEIGVMHEVTILDEPNPGTYLASDSFGYLVFERGKELHYRELSAFHGLLQVNWSSADRMLHVDSEMVHANQSMRIESFEDVLMALEEGPVAFIYRLLWKGQILDGPQYGARLKEKTPLTRTYVVSSDPGKKPYRQAILVLDLKGRPISATVEMEKPRWLTTTTFKYYSVRLAKRDR